MFPYQNGGLRYDDGGWFVNDSYVIDDVGNNWIGFGVGMNSDWWECSQDPGYFYLENIDGGAVNTENGTGTVPVVFKISPYQRINSGDNLDVKLASNTRILAYIYAETLNRLASEWVVGFLVFAQE